MNPREKVTEALKQIDEAIENIGTNEEWLKFLSFQTKFYRYSYGNTLLIYLQNPEASFVKGFRSWNELGRYVKKGEKGIKILAPCIKKVMEEDTDDETDAKKKLVGFRVAYVYDILSTDGSDEFIPTLVGGLKGNSKDETKAYEQMKAYIGTKHHIEEVVGTASKGSFNLVSGDICIRKDLDALQKIKTLIHEYAHSIDHEINPSKDIPINHRELVAESTAFVVSSALGYDTSDYSFGYLNSWSHANKDNIKKVADAIQKVACRIIDEFLDNGICAERLKCHLAQ